MFCSEKLDQYTTLLHLLCIVGCPVLDRVNLLSAVHQLEERHVVLGLQRDVVEAMNLVFERKRSQKVRQVALEGSDVVLEVQHDVTAGTRPICHAKR